MSSPAIDLLTHVNPHVEHGVSSKIFEKFEYAEGAGTASA
jgi:hypothetical protein